MTTPREWALAYLARAERARKDEMVLPRLLADAQSRLASKWVRKKATQEAVAAKLGVSPQRLSEYRNGLHPMPDEKFIELAMLAKKYQPAAIRLLGEYHAERISADSKAGLWLAKSRKPGGRFKRLNPGAPGVDPTRI